MVDQITEIRFLSGGHVIDDNHLVAAIDEFLAEMRPDKSGSAGDKTLTHVNSFP